MRSLHLPGWIGALFQFSFFFIPQHEIVFAQEMATDRPDQTESSLLVPPGYVELETGWTYTREDQSDEKVREHTFPETLLRLGLTEEWELRFAMQGHVWKDESSPLADSHLEEEGWDDTEIGFKRHLWSEEASCFCPEAALIAHLTLPSGAENFSSERFDPSFRFLFSHSITETLSFGYNLGAEWETEWEDGDEDTLGVFQYTASLGKDLTEKLACYIELYGDIPLNADGKPQNSIDGGIIYLVKENFQLDFSIGTGLSDQADDFLIGCGISYRWPK